MKNHFDNNFSMQILGNRATSVQIEKDRIKVAKAAEDKAVTGIAAENTDAKGPQETGPKNFLTSLLSAFDDEQVEQVEEEVKETQKVLQKALTKIKLDIDLFYAENNEKIINL